MTNLDRLKGTPYLMDGFETFLKHWQEKMPTQFQPPPWTPGEEKILRSMPVPLQQFYELVYRWSSKGFGGRTSHLWHLIIPPRKVVMRRDPETSDNVKVEFTRVLIAVGARRAWSVELSLDEADYGTLYIDVDANSNRAETIRGIPLEAPLDEFLVTLGFHNLILESDPELQEPIRFETAELIYQGRCFADRDFSIYFHPDGFLWLVEGLSKDAEPLACARQPRFAINPRAGRARNRSRTR